MKRGTTPTLRVAIDFDFSRISRVEFVFKQYEAENAPEIIKKAYPQDVTYDSENGLFLIELTDEETRLFGESRAYMDTRIITAGGKIPHTGIVSLDVAKTLFEEVYADD